jgi:hypothetical protein
MSSPLAVVRSQPTPSMPDIAWIRVNVPILRVAQGLGMRVRGLKARCWRPERHANRDADPSLCFSKKRNRVRCMVCDMRGGHSCVDLVAGVLGIETGAAVRWIAERFPVPNVRRGRPAGAKANRIVPYLAGLAGNVFELLVRSGMFGELSAAERSILIALETLKDHDSGTTRISYRGIQRYAGLSSNTTVSKALKRLQQIHAIQISRGARTGVTRESSCYRVTLEDEKFVARCNELYSVERKKIDKEREVRKWLRRERERQSNQRRSLNTKSAGGLRVPRTPALLSLEYPKASEEKNAEEANLKVQNLCPPDGLQTNKAVHAEYRLNEVWPSEQAEFPFSPQPPNAKRTGNNESEAGR